MVIELLFAPSARAAGSRAAASAAPFRTDRRDISEVVRRQWSRRSSSSVSQCEAGKDTTIFPGCGMPGGAQGDEDHRERRLHAGGGPHLLRTARFEAVAGRVARSAEGSFEQEHPGA